MLEMLSHFSIFVSPVNFQTCSAFTNEPNNDMADGGFEELEDKGTVAAVLLKHELRESLDGIRLRCVKL